MEVLTQALESGYTSFQPSLSHAWDAMWTPGSQRAPSQQVVVAAVAAVGEASLLAGSPGRTVIHAHMRLLESLWTIPRSEGNKSRLSGEGNSS